jgi:hypothetical protein
LARSKNRNREMLKSCKTCRHDPKSCKFQNYNDKCNGHQQISIDEKKKELHRLIVSGGDYSKLQKEINYFEWGC